MSGRSSATSADVDLPPRLEVAVHFLDPLPGDRLVEVGCGHGVAATLVLDRLVTGTYTGIDRSAAMIAAAARRNAAAVTAGRASFVEAAVEDLTLAPFDRLFAARVAALVRPAGLDAMWRLLVPGGWLLLAFDAPDGTYMEVADRARELVSWRGFDAVTVTQSPYDGGVIDCVRATRPPM